MTGGREAVSTHDQGRPLTHPRAALQVALLGSAILAACGPGELVVSTEMTAPDPVTGDTVTLPLPDLEIVLLPYDRDAVFDSLAAVAATPEPVVPPDLVRAQTNVAGAQALWSQSQRESTVLRDSLQKLSTEMQSRGPGGPASVALLQEFSTVQRKIAEAEGRMRMASGDLGRLSRVVIARSEQVRLQREVWATTAFANADAVFTAKAREAGLPAVADTTDAQGVARFEAPPGRYWVHARYEQGYDQLYWNLPVEIERGEPVEVRLGRGNAERRPGG